MSGSRALPGEMSYYMANMARERGNTTEAVRLLTDALNTNQPFMYRKAAQELLSQLSKQDRSPDAKGGAGQGSATGAAPTAK